MPRCKKCGKDIIDNKRLCSSCLSKWCKKRLDCWKKVVIEIGEPTAQNKKEFDKRIKKCERE